MATVAIALFAHRRERSLALQRAHSYHRCVRDALDHDELGLARQAALRAARFRKRVAYHSKWCRHLEELCD